MKQAAVLLVLALGAALAAGAWWLRGAPPPVEARLAVAEALAGDTVGYARAEGPRAFAFPADHGPHPDFKTEWWYFTGNLEGPGGARFGYQLTIFRTAVAPADSALAGRSSAWASRQVYMAHFAVTDAAGKAFAAHERFSRGAAGLAGASPARVWIEDWEITADSGGFRVRASEGEVGIDLVCRPAKPYVLQGDRGYDRKGAAPGDASYYYSATRLATEGRVTTARGAFEAQGWSWLDREWSTSALSPDQQGWDWFALQLSDGREMMYYQIRQKDGGVSPFSDGVLVAADGRTRALSREDVRIAVGGQWRSPKTGAAYPASWRIEVPSDGLRLEAQPLLPGQEMDLTVRYWEGAVRLRGVHRGRPVSGYGYVEMTGYGERAGARLP